MTTGMTPAHLDVYLDESVVRQMALMPLLDPTDPVDFVYGRVHNAVVDASLDWVGEHPELPTEPPIGSLIIDSDGDLWQRHSTGWANTYGDTDWDWQDMLDAYDSFNEVKVVKDGNV